MYYSSSKLVKTTNKSIDFILKVPFKFISERCLKSYFIRIIQMNNNSRKIFKHHYYKYSIIIYSYKQIIIK